MEIVNVKVSKGVNGAIEGMNNKFTTNSASMYLQLPNANGKIVYTITTCNRSADKRYELTNLYAPMASLNTSLLYFENLIVGDALRLGVNQTLYPETSDATTARTIKETTNALLLTGTANYNTSVAANNTQHSWSVGNYYRFFGMNVRCIAKE
mgnify:CR=1 FL=1